MSIEKSEKITALRWSGKCSKTTVISHPPRHPILVFFLEVMAVSDAPHAGCCIQADTVDVPHRLDNVRSLDMGKQTSRETAAVQPSVM